ncbi:hypothetical protein [Deinococcus multiflagellatus]|uniref:DNA adenine methylase n=1 Tax=Deinococcus multiflagellatus TaxID=1656887 RepID=A0ABW1ZNY9_9DEIO|nr:hypothetical protein [Deinococcus multiflagellatus]MBZ9715587.1 hypothetical protein [Deinococcus multiflagellatus]
MSVLPIQTPENVSRVKTRGVFRYPGGKTWFTPSLLQFLNRHPPSLFVEPFAGGGALSAAVLDKTSAKIWLNELDSAVVAVHRMVFSARAPRLAQRILDFELTLDRVQRELALTPKTELDLAFQTILRNRVNRGGILAPGAGLVRRGEKGKGLAQRWYPQTLANRIAELAAHRHRVTVTQGDALAILARTPFRAGTAIFVDPPCAAGIKSAGRRLYTHHDLDHARLFDVCAELTVPWVMTHEHDPEVMGLAWAKGLRWRTVKMTSGHNVTARELVIGRTLEWADDCSGIDVCEPPVQPTLFGPAVPLPSRPVRRAP